MSASRVAFISASLLAFALAACGSNGSSAGGGSSGLAIKGNVGPARGASSMKSQSYGGVVVGAGLHVVAYKLHAKGDHAARADVAVAGDGSFRVEVDRGARYVVDVESADGRSAAIIGFDGASGSYGVIDVTANGSSAEVDVGALDVSGGVARSSVKVDGASGASVSVARDDEYLDTIDGATLRARDAIDAARQACAEACSRAKQALMDAQSACAAAGNVCGTSVDEAKAESDAACAAADSALAGL